MVRAFTPADVVQSVPGTASLQPSVTVSLTNPAVEGRGGLIVMAAQLQLAPPEQWHTAAGSGSSDDIHLLKILARPDLLAGEQSWGFATDNASQATWAWIIEEWTNVSFAPLQPSARTLQTTSPAAISTGTTDTFNAPYVVGVAAVMLTGAPTGPVWPTSCTWSNGFTETEVQSVGTGQGGTDLQLRVARRYGTLNDTGGWETTATFNATQTNRLAYACLATFRSEYQLGDI